MLQLAQGAHVAVSTRYLLAPAPACSCRVAPTGRQAVPRQTASSAPERSLQSRYSRLPLSSAALLDAPAAQQDEVDPEDEDAEHADLADLPLPDVRHQLPLDLKDMKLLRTQANTAAKSKTLQNMTVGQNGVTVTVLSAIQDILIKHQFLRLRLGEGCGLDRKKTATQLEQLLDAVCVYQIGYTITLYRQQGLPRPSNCPPNHDLPEVPILPEEDQASLDAAKGTRVGKAVRRVAQSARQQAGRAAYQAQKRPSEFQVV